MFLRSVFVLVLAILTASFSFAEEYWVDDGQSLTKADGNPAQVTATEWQIRLYKNRKPTGGRDYWGLITGDTAESVMKQLKKEQEFQMVYAKWANRDYREEENTNFNYTGPIAMIERQKALPQRLLVAGEKIKSFKEFADLLLPFLQEDAKEQSPLANCGHVLSEYLDNLKDAQERFYEFKKRLKVNDSNLQVFIDEMQEMESSIERVERHYSAIETPVLCAATNHTLSEINQRLSDGGSLLKTWESALEGRQPWNRAQRIVDHITPKGSAGANSAEDGEFKDSDVAGGGVRNLQKISVSGSNLIIDQQVLVADTGVGDLNETWHIEVPLSELSEDGVNDFKIEQDQKRVDVFTTDRNENIIYKIDKKNSSQTFKSYQFSLNFNNHEDAQSAAAHLRNLIRKAKGLSADGPTPDKSTPEREQPRQAASLDVYKDKLASGDVIGAMAAARELTSALKDDANSLNDIAWRMVDPNKPVANCDLNLAKEIAKRSNEVANGEDPAILDTLARVCFVRGEFLDAVKFQAQAVRKAGEKDMSEEKVMNLDDILQPPYSKTLAKYMSALKNSR